MNPSLPELQTIPCAIVLIPNEEQSRLAIQASQLLSLQGSLFTLDDQNFYAHTSLYMFQMSISNQDACVAALQQIAEQAKSQRLEQDGYAYQDSGFYKGYIDVSFARNKEADSLQKSVVDTFNSLRTGIRESSNQRMTDATGLRLENLQKYDYPNIGELFRPHITLTKFPAEIEPDLTVLPSSAIFSGKFTRIGLFEIGTNGTCIRKITEFNLKS